MITPEKTITKEIYAELLKDPRWAAKRIEILKRDNNTCRFCGFVGNIMHIHHKYYLPDLKPWEYENKALMVLCPGCHHLHHELQRMKSSDFPPLFFPPFKCEATFVTEKLILRDDYFTSSVPGKKIPMQIIKQLKLVNKLFELSYRYGSDAYKRLISCTQVGLNDMCLRSNVKLSTIHTTYGVGDVTDLKHKQYL